jgi:hypothetical protein
VLSFSSNYVENECIAWDFLVLLDFDDVSCLNAAPIRDLKALAPFGEYKLFNRL